MRTCADDNLEFFTEYINITSDDVKALKVARTLYVNLVNTAIS